MPLLFQANPDRWDLRASLKRGAVVRWYVTRYKSLMQPGMVVLLWSARGKKLPKTVRGLYGWGLTVGELQADDLGYDRIPVRHVERWVDAEQDKAQVALDQQDAPLSAETVLQLPSWQDHLLGANPVGANFVVSEEQLAELADTLVLRRFRGSQLGQALGRDGVLNPQGFRFLKLTG